MSILDINMDNIPELKLIEDGKEVRLQIKAATEVPIKAQPDKIQYKVVLDDPADPLVDDIIKYLPRPTQADREIDEKAYAKQGNILRDFCKCFNIPTADGVDVDSFPGSEGDCIVGVESDLQFGTKNIIQRVVVPK